MGDEQRGIDPRWIEVAKILETPPDPEEEKLVGEFIESWKKNHKSPARGPSA